MRVPLSDVRARQVSLHCPARGRGYLVGGKLTDDRRPMTKADLAFGPWELKLEPRCAALSVVLARWRRGDIIGPGPTVDVENMKEYLAFFACVLFSFFLSFFISFFLSCGL